MAHSNAHSAIYTGSLASAVSAETGPLHWPGMPHYLHVHLCVYLHVRLNIAQGF